MPPLVVIDVVATDQKPAKGTKWDMPIRRGGKGGG
jgi:hypothetical protein